jgi:hypothetical protein
MDQSIKRRLETTGTAAPFTAHAFCPFRLYGIGRNCVFNTGITNYFKMKNFKILIVSLITVMALSVGYASPPKTVKEVYDSQIGVREQPAGSNWGTPVKMYLAAVQVKVPAAWCAAFVKWSFDQAQVNTTITAWSPTAHNKKNVLYEKGQLFTEPRSGDVFTLYFIKLKRIAHTGFYDRRVNNKVYRSVEGNTNEAGSREGDGVYIKYRSYRATHSITRWT